MLSNVVSSNRSISAIAFDSGFGDLSYFNNTFRRRFGATPTDVRPRQNRLGQALRERRSGPTTHLTEFRLFSNSNRP